MSNVVIIPARDERSLGRLIRAILALEVFDVLVLDGGGNGPIPCVNDRVERIEVPKGLGIAVRRGLEVALERGYSRVFRVDGDGQYKPELLRKLLAALFLGEEFVIGSRYHPESEGDDPPIDRLLFHRTIAPLINRVTGFQMHDVISGMWGLDAGWLSRMLPELETKGYGLTIELVLRRAARDEPQPAEVPHPRIYTGSGKCTRLYRDSGTRKRMERIMEYFMLLSKLFRKLGFDEALLRGGAGFTETITGLEEGQNGDESQLMLGEAGVISA